MLGSHLLLGDSLPQTPCLLLRRLTIPNTVAATVPTRHLVLLCINFTFSIQNDPVKSLSWAPYGSPELKWPWHPSPVGNPITSYFFNHMINIGKSSLLFSILLSVHLILLSCLLNAWFRQGIPRSVCCIKEGLVSRKSRLRGVKKTPRVTQQVRGRVKVTILVWLSSELMVFHIGPEVSNSTMQRSLTAKVNTWKWWCVCVCR